jgi:hypothetical protein
MPHSPRRPSFDETTSARRDAWRIALFQEQVAAEAAARRRAAAMRWAVMLGVALGIAGSVSMHL